MAEGGHYSDLRNVSSTCEIVDLTPSMFVTLVPNEPYDAVPGSRSGAEATVRRLGISSTARVIAA